MIPEDGEGEGGDIDSSVQMNMNEITGEVAEQTTIKPSVGHIHMQLNVTDQWQRIAATLELEKQRQTEGRAGQGEVQMQDSTEEAELETAAPAKDFKKKRNAHYNEFHLVQAMREKRERKKLRRAAKGKGEDESDSEDSDSNDELG